MTTAIPMSEAVLAAQVPVDYRSFIGDVIQLGFAIVVAAYLLVKTTNAIHELTLEVRALNSNFDSAKKEVQHQGSQIRQEVRALTEATRRIP